MAIPTQQALVIAAALCLALGTRSAQAQAVLEGDAGLACEAMLCLASAARPAACRPALSRFFSIVRRRWHDTARARLDFLDLCPVQSADLDAVKSRIAHGARPCDAASLNQQLRVEQGASGSFISDQLPYHCSAHAQAIAGDAGPPSVAYVGTPDQGGHWADAADYPSELQAYLQRLARERAPAMPLQPD